MTTKYDAELGERIVAAAREFLGARWQHQGRSAQGIDCCGFIVETAIRSGALSDVSFEADYRRQENGERMLALLEQHLDPVAEGEERPGDVLALCDEQLKYPTRPVHLAFLTRTEPYMTMIHASERGVAEHRMDAHFKRRVTGRYRVRSERA